MSHDEQVNPTIKVQPVRKDHAEPASVEEHVQRIARTVGAFLARGFADAWHAVRPENSQKGQS